MTGGHAEDEIDGEEPENASGDHAASDARRESGSQDECLAGHRCDSPLSLASICHGKSRHGWLRPLAGWHGRVVQKVSRPFGPASCDHRSCPAVQAFLRRLNESLPTAMGMESQHRGINREEEPPNRFKK
jgi:hypothetical protein